LAAHSFPAKSAKGQLKRSWKKKKIKQKHVIFRNPENHIFLSQNMQTRISTEQTRGNCYGLDPG